jgi:hypothetical protein
MKVVNGFLLTECKFVADDALANLGIHKGSEYDVFRIKLSEILAWNISQDGDGVTVRTIVGDYTINMTIEDMDILMLSNDN